MSARRRSRVMASSTRGRVRKGRRRERVGRKRAELRSSPQRPQRRRTACAALGVAGLVGLGMAWYALRPVLRPQPTVVLPSQLEGLDSALVALIERHAGAVQRSPRDARHHATLGLVYEANEMWSEAQACFETASRLAPDEVLWPYHAAIVQQRAANFHGALTRLREVASTYPDFAPAQHRLGEALVKVGDLVAAGRAFGQAVALAPHAPQALVGLAEVRIRQRDYAGAVPVLENALAMYPNYKMAHYLLGSAYRGLGRMEEATRELSLGVAAKRRYLPDATTSELRNYYTGLSVQFGRARDLVDVGRLPEAAGILERALASRPADARVMNNLANVYVRMGRNEKALDMLLHAEHLDDAYFPTFLNLAHRFLQMKQPADALIYADRAVALAPTLGHAHFQKGSVLLALQRNEEAHEALRTAVRLDTRDPKVLLALGEVCTRLNRLREANEYFERAVHRMPSQTLPHIKLCIIRMRLGLFDEAAEALAPAQRLAPRDPQVQALAEQLSALRAP